MQNQEMYFVFGTAVINGYKETVYLTKSGETKQNVEKEDLMLFESSKAAFEYTKAKSLDLAEWDKLSNF